MPGEAADLADVRIEPSVQQIARLSPSIASQPWRHFGSPPSFSGLLQPARPRPSDRPGPTLSYLTLQSLVVRHVRERTDRGSIGGAGDRTGTADETGTGEVDNSPVDRPAERDERTKGER